MTHTIFTTLEHLHYYTTNITKVLTLDTLILEHLHYYTTNITKVLTLDTLILEHLHY